MAGNASQKGTGASTLAAAASLGTLTSTATVVSDFVGQAVPDDWYKFSVGSLSNVSLQLAGLLDSVSISLLDANGNQIRSYSASSSNPALFFSDLAAGTYYLHVNSTNDTPFTLSASATALPNATGQSFAAATALAAPTATVASVSDWVGAAAPNDFYTFTLASAATVNFKLGSTLDSLTLYDANGAEIASASPGSGYPLLSNALAAGTYYVKVNSSYDNAYTLSYWTGAPTVGTASATDNAGNDIAGANATALGALTAAAKTVAGWVGTSDTDDYYKVSVTGPTTVALSLSGVSGNPLLSLYDASGNEIRSDYAYAATPGSIVATLATGTYYIDVNNYDGSTGYSLSASATALPNAVGTSQAKATSLGALSSTVVTKSDWVGSVAPDDYYSFTLSSLSSVSLNLSGLSNTSGYLYLLNSSGGQIASSYYYYNSDAIAANLAAGTYYVHLYDTSDTAYTLSASATALPNAAGATLATATSLGALSTTAATASDWVGNAAPNDYYQFTLSALSNVTLKLSGLANANGTLSLLDSSGNQYGYSYASGSDGFLVANLAAGTYYVNVHDSYDTTYTLSASAAALPNAAGSSLATALNVGALGATAIVESDWIGNAASTDYYTFSLSASKVVNLTFASSNGSSGSIFLLDSSGGMIGSSTYNGLGGLTSVVATLAKGTYFAEVADGIDTNYSLTFSTGAPAVGTSATDGADNSLAAAKAIGALSATAKTYADWVGATDAKDVYQFTLSSLSTVTLQLAGLASGASDTLALYDANGAQVAYTYAGSSYNGLISDNLSAGTYYAVITGGGSDSGYNFSASAAALPSAIGTTLAMSTSLGALGTTAVTKSDWIGAAAPDDYYSFTLGALATVSFTFSGGDFATLTLLDNAGNRLASANSYYYNGHGDSPIAGLSATLAAGTYYLHLSDSLDTAYKLTAVSSVAAGIAPALTAGRSLAAATSLGALSATAVAKTDWVGDAAPDEWFKFTVGAPSSVSLNLSGLVNSATLTLLDANGGQINYASGNASATGGLLANLAAGTYYAKINAGSDTPFTLTASATALPNAAGQTLAAATALAAPTATVASVSDWVGAAAPNDYYTFTLASAATVNLQLASTLDTLTLYDASGAEIASASPGSGYPLLTNALAAGTYYVKVNGSSNGAYTLSSWTGAATVGTSSASDTAGNTLAAANATTFGALTSTAKTVAGWVSATDTDDYYKFTVTGPATVALSLSGVSATAYLNLYNAAGDSIRSDYAYSTTPGSLVANLATGTYYVDVNNYYGSTGYSLSASATALPNAAGTTLAIATSLGALSSTAVTKSDWVGAAAPDDYYSFTLASLSSVSLKLSGLANTSGYLYLLNSSGDQITSSYYYYFGGALTANLGAGTYYVRVNDTTDTAYTLAASAATLANAGGATLATATSLGALGTGVVTKSDWIGAAAANDYYSFTLSARSTVNLKFSGVTNNGAYLYLLDSSGAQVGNNYPSNDLAQPITLNATLAAGTYYIRINDNSDTAYTLTAVSNTAAGTAPTISSGRALSTAASLGTLTSTATVVSDFVGQAVPDDWYKFSVGSLSNVSLQLAGLLDSASISLLDANGNQIGSYSASSSNPALFFSDLAAGIYYLHVNSTNDTPFTLTASATALPNATGQSFAAATALAAPTATVASVSDWVGAAAPNDFYKFTLASAATVNFKVGSTLDSLTLYDANGVQIASASPGAGYPLLSNALAAGTYYVKVNSSYDNAYTLSYWTGAPTIGSSSTTDNAGNDIAGANATALGALTAAAKTVVGWVGTSDTDDYYKISVTGPTTVALSLSGVSGNPLLSLYDASGNEIRSDYAYAATPGSIVATLATGTYYIDVNNYDGSTGYSLSASATALPNAVGTSQAKATSLGALSSTVVTKSDWVGSVAPDDYYSFTLSSLSSVSLNLSGLSNTSGYLYLLNSSGGQIASSYYYYNSDAIAANLAAGTYYVHLYDTSDTAYTLSASATALPNAAGATLATATSLGALSTTAATASDWVGNAAPNDYYQFTLSALSNVTLKLSGLANANGYLYLLNSSGGQITSTYYGYTNGALTANLAAGTYYINVNDTYDTAYTLSASATALPNAAGATLATATSVGALGATAIVKSDWIGSAASTDYYAFSVSASTLVSLKLATANGVNGTIYLLNSSGGQIASSYYGAGGLTSIVSTLAAGTYYAEVASSSDSSYSLTFSTGTAAVGSSATDGAGNTLAAAKAIGALASTAKTYADWVGATDATDVYQFTLSSLSSVTLQLSGLASGAFDTFTLYDANGAQLDYTYAASNYNGLISDNLAAGTYYAVIASSGGSDTGYNFSASATALPNATGTTLASATSLGALGTTAVVKSDWIGQVAPNDYYSFTLGALATVSFTFTGAWNGSSTLALLDSAGNQITSAYPYNVSTQYALSATLAAGTYYLRLSDSYDTAYTLTAVSSAAAGTAPALTAGRSLAGAASLGALSATAVAKTDWVGDAAPDEWFKFTVGAPSSVSLNLSGLVNSATLTLLDANGGQINYASGNASATGGLLANLAAGTYYAKINAGSDTPFTLTASATALPNAAGQTLAAATALAAPTATVASVSDWVGAAAPNDYYTFTLASAATVNLQLASTLDTLTLYDASGAEIASASPGSGYPLLTNALAAGTYYVKVNGSSNGAYTLSSWTGAATVGTSSASDTAGNTLAAANATTFGALTSTAKTVAGWVSATDTDDYYKFTVTGPATVALSLSGVSATAYLNLYNAAGDSIRSDYAYSTTPGSLVANLATGTYYVDVNNYYGSTGYSLSASATALPNAAGTTLAIATSLGALSSTAVTKSDWVGAAAPDDYYSFTLASLSSVALNLSGQTGSSYVNVALLDSAGNQIDWESVSPTTPSTLLANLAAGTYYVHIDDPNSDTAYTLTASATATTNQGGATLASAKALGTLGTVTVSDSINTAAPVDYYSFTVGGQRPVALQLTGLTSNATLTLFDASGQRITTAYGGASSYATILKTLAAGQYFAEVSGASSTTAYKFVATTTPILTAKLTSDTGSSATDLITNTPSLTGTGNISTTVKFTIDGVAAATTATSTTTGAWTYVPTGLADGKHTVIVSETDPVGDVGATSLTFTLDTTPPTVTAALVNDTGVSGTDKVTSAVSLSGTADANAVVSFTVDGVAATTTATANASGAWTFTPSGLADGVHTIVASQTDIAGNVGKATLTVTRDITAPAVTAALTSDTGASATDKLTSNAAVSGSGDPNAVVSFTIDGVAASATATADATGAWSFAPTGLADGQHTIVASETDLAGNAGSASLTFTLDATAPVVTEKLTSDTGVSSTDKITSNPALSGSGEANAVVSLQFDGGAVSVTTTADAAGAWSYAPTGLADGAHTVIASETDAAGNAGSVSLAFTLDKTAPVVAAKLTSDTGASSTDKITSNPGVSGSGDPNAVVSFVVDGVAVTTTATADATGAWSFAPTGLADGAHTIVASETDAAGNKGSASLAFTLDKTAPVVTEKLTSDTGASATDKITSKAGLSGTGQASAVVKFVVDGVAATTTATADATGAWTYAPTGLADGAHTVVASETDVAGNTGSASLTFTLDTKAPVVTAKLTSDTGSSATDKITSNAALSGTGDPNAVVRFTIDGVAATATATANASGAWTYAPTGLADGAHTIVASQTDAAGNVGSASLTFTLDTKAPAPTIGLANDTGASSSDKVTTDPSLYGLGDPNAVVRFTVDGVAATVTATAGATGAWSYTPTGLAVGAHTIVASETDAAGNVGTASLSFTLASAPVLSPKDATVAMGASVAASSLFSATLANGDAITTYEFIDANAGASSGSFVLNGVTQSAGGVLDVAASDIAKLKFVGGSAVGVDDIWVRASNALDYGNWIDVQVQTQGPSVTPPTIAAGAAKVAANASLALASLFQVTDPNGLAISEYQFVDLNTSATSGHIALGTTAAPAGQIVDFPSALLPTASFAAGAAGSVDTLAVRAYDGGAWSAWTQFTVTTTS